MDQQQAANGGEAAEFADPGAAGGDSAMNGAVGGTPSGQTASGSTSPTNNGLNNNEAKRVKLDPMKGASGNGGNPGGGGGGTNAPSKVIHIRNIPNDVTEAEIIHLGIPFGRVTNVLVLKGKNQAFLEMEDESSATAMVNYFTGCSAQLRERSVYVQFSNHKQLKTDQTHSNASASAQAALQAAQALTGGADIQSVQQKLANGNAGTSSAGGVAGGNAGAGGANTVLRVIVEHMVYPVTLDVIYQIFSRVGKVLKIVTFTKNNTFQALIQYPDVITAQAAKMSLDGQNIYNACCMLRIEYSKLSNLNVKYNNDKSRDYTNPGLPTGDATMDNLAAVGQGQPGQPNQPGGMQGQSAAAAGMLGSPFTALGLTNPLAAYGSTAGLTGMATGLPGFPLGVFLFLSS